MADKRILCNRVTYYRPSGFGSWERVVLKNVRLQTADAARRDGIAAKTAVLWVFPAVLGEECGVFCPRTGDLFQPGDGGAEPDSSAFLVDGIRERRSAGRAALTHFRISGVGGEV